VDQPVADVLVVFGGPAAVARVQAAADYVARTPAAAKPLIILTGGWPGVSRGTAEPPAGHREAELMLAHARALDLDRAATLVVEDRSRSTLENLLNIAEFLDGRDFGPARPLGLVSHSWHLPRVRFLASRVLGLRGAALLDVPVRSRAGLTPRVLYVAARLGYLNARRPEQMRRRERRIVAVAAWLRRLRRG
jgi:uncharacterized SAM-binding protein YcdF (DUF218 family)